MSDKVRLIEKLIDLHRKGSLHVMDRGSVCVGCGDRWPCPTTRIIWRYAGDLPLELEARLS